MSKDKELICIHCGRKVIPYKEEVPAHGWKTFHRCLVHGNDWGWIPPYCHEKWWLEEVAKKEQELKEMRTR